MRGDAMPQMPKEAPPPGRAIEHEAEVHLVVDWRREVIATLKRPVPGNPFAFMSDEGGEFPGGGGTAPPPLSYFLAGIAL
jgi:hypothetical protein